MVLIAAVLEVRVQIDLEANMSKDEMLDSVKDLTFRMNKLVREMYAAGFTDDDIQYAVDEGAQEYRIMMGIED